MNMIDWGIVSIITLSCLISIKRGFVKEAISLAIWVIAFVVSMLFHESFAFLLIDYIPEPSIRRLIAMGLLFMATLLVGSLVNYLIAQLVKMTGLTGTDRLLGVIFGFFRGVILIVVLLIFVPAFAPVEVMDLWLESELVPQFQMLEGWSRETGQVLLEFLLDFSKS